MDDLHISTNTQQHKHKPEHSESSTPSDGSKNSATQTSEAKMTNNSGLRPLGRAVLLAPYDPEIKSSVIAIPEHVQSRMQQVDQRAIVVAVGPECWKDERQPRAKPGDKVMVAKYAGVMITGPKDHNVYRMVNANDIFTAIEEE